MKTEVFNLAITFSFLGTVEQAKEHFKPLTSELNVEVNEFEGTDEEHHSGTFETPLTVIDGDLVGALTKIINENDLRGECFQVKNAEGLNILNEMEYQMALDF